MANIDNGSLHDKNKRPNQSTKKVAENESNYGDKLVIYYTHMRNASNHVSEIRMYKVYEDVFKATPAIYTKFIVGS